MPIKPKALIKRSVRIAGHRTSVALEQEFWDKLELKARDYRCTMPVFLARIEAHYQKDERDFSLASACRVYALDEPTLSPSTQTATDDPPTK